MEKESDDLEFDDGESFQYNNQGQITHEQLILQAMKRCMEEGSKEMKGGYFKQSVNNQGQVKEIWVDDQKQIYIQSIKSLYDVMIPKHDEIFKKDDAKFNQELVKIKERAIGILKMTLKQIEDREKLDNMSYSEHKQRIQSQIVTESLDPDSYEAKLVSDSTLDAYRGLYQALIRCYGRKGFGTEEVIDDTKE